VWSPKRPYRGSAGCATLDLMSSLRKQGPYAVPPRLAAAYGSRLCGRDDVDVEMRRAKREHPCPISPSRRPNSAKVSSMPPMTASSLRRPLSARGCRAVFAQSSMCMAAIGARGTGDLSVLGAVPGRARVCGLHHQLPVDQAGTKNLSGSRCTTCAPPCNSRAAAPRNCGSIRALRAVGQFGGRPARRPGGARGRAPLFAGAYRQDPHAGVSTGVKVLIGVLRHL